MYSISDSEDWRIRGYAKCPAYQQRLSAWLRSDDFKQKEQESQALREQVIWGTILQRGLCWR